MVSPKGSFDIFDVAVDVSSPVKDLFKLIRKDNGELDLVKVGEKNIQKEIDSYRDDCDIYVQLARYLKGDTSTGIGTSFVGSDVTGMQVDLNTLHNSLSSLNDSLQSNSSLKEYLDTKPSFNNDSELIEGYSKFMESKKNVEVKKENE